MGEAIPSIIFLIIIFIITMVVSGVFGFKGLFIFIMGYATISLLPALPKILRLAVINRFRAWKNWGLHWVIDERVDKNHYFFPCHQDAVDWLKKNDFKRSILGGYIIPGERWKFAHKGLRDEVGCLMEMTIKI